VNSIVILINLAQANIHIIHDQLNYVFNLQPVLPKQQDNISGHMDKSSGELEDKTDDKEESNKAATGHG
jgi:hypothetical protein